MKRWHIVATKKPQNLAEHSFNVAQISMAILDELCPPDNWMGRVCELAINHDINEVLIGDMPTPAKNKGDYNFDGPLTPELLVKMADIIDAYTFIKMNAVDRHGEKVIEYVQEMLDKMIKQLTTRAAGAVRKVVAHIIHGEMEV